MKDKKLRSVASIVQAMNRTLAVIVLTSGGMLLGANVNVGETYTTHDSNGKVMAVFTMVQGPGKFGNAWRDPNGVVWSKLIAEAQNMGPSYDEGQNGFIVSGEAVDACKAIGGDLPSMEDYEKLTSYFEYTGVHFTDQGQRDLETVFPELVMAAQYWTTSFDPWISVDPIYHYRARFFSGYFAGYIGYDNETYPGYYQRGTEDRFYNLWVRCLAK